MTSKYALIFCATVLGCSAMDYAIGCPDGQSSTSLGFCLPNAPVPTPHIPPISQVDPVKLVINPMSYINPTGIPTVGDFAEEVIKHPDQAIQLIAHPDQWPYVPVADGIISGRNAALANGAQPIPSDIRQFLTRWYSDDLLSSIRWTSNWNAVQNTLQAAQMTFNGDTLAITLINVIVFKNPAVVQDKALWAHELMHAQQYRDWGVYGFAKKWVDNSAHGGPVEGPAYARQDEASQILAQSFNQIPGNGGGNPGPLPVPPPPLVAAGLPSGTWLGPCGCNGPLPPGAQRQNMQCASHVDVPRVCAPQQCMGGGFPWAPSCL